MSGKNDQNFIAFCGELRAYVLEKRHFPNKHTRLLNKIKFVRRKINQGTLEEWKLKMFLDIEGMCTSPIRQQMIPAIPQN